MTEAGVSMVEINKAKEAPGPKTETTADKITNTDSNPAAKVEYKIIKVRKPDGTIVKVRRPIPLASTTENESKATGQSSLTTSPAQDNKTTEITSKASQTPETAGGSPLIEIVSVRKPDGTIVKVRRRVPSTEIKQPLEPKKDTAASSKETVTSGLTSGPVLSSELGSASLQTPVQASAQHATEISIKHIQAPSAYTVFRGLNRLHSHYSSKVIGAFVPDWGIGDFEDGDEYVSDNDDDDDDDDDDTGDDEVYSSDEYQDRFDTQSDQHTTENEKAVTGRSHAIARALPPTYLTAQKAAHTTSPQIPEIQAKPQEPAKTVTKRKGEPNILEKEIPNASDVKDIKQSVKSRTLTNSKYADWARYLVWAITIILPLLFIILGIMTAVITGRPEDDKTGKKVTQVLIIAVSAWPIIFAAIAAQSLRALATYRVERGIRLMTLEQLISSNSVASSIKQPFILRRINGVTIILLCLWGLSPLTSQAMQRVSSTASGATNSSMSFSYVNTYQKNLAFDIMPHLQAGQTTYAPNINRYYSAAFLPSTSETPTQDTWGSPRIPIFEQLPAGLEVDAVGWHLIPPDGLNLKYSSIFGIPTVPFFTENPKTAPPTQYEFIIQSAYLNLDCQFLNATTMDVINATGVTLSSSQSQTLFLSLVPTNSTLTPVSPSIPNAPGTLTFASSINNNVTRNETFAYSVCTFNQTFVNSKLFCNEASCFVYGMKLITDPQQTPYTTMGPFAQQWLLAAGAGVEFGFATDTEKYILDPGNVVFADTDYSDLSQISLEDFTERLGILLNTIWQTGFAPMYTTNNLVPNNTAQVIVNDVTGTKAVSKTTYTTNWGWLAILLISSTILLTAGVAAVIWDTMTISPDVLGFASSVVRRSKYVDLPKVDTAASGAERARLLGSVKVMMQDVKPEAEVGKIVLGTVHEKAERLRAGRMYR